MSIHVSANGIISSLATAPFSEENLCVPKVSSVPSEQPHASWWSLGLEHRGCCLPRVGCSSLTQSGTRLWPSDCAPVSSVGSVPSGSVASFQSKSSPDPVQGLVLDPLVLGCLGSLVSFNVEHFHSLPVNFLTLALWRIWRYILQIFFSIYLS